MPDGHHRLPDGRVKGKGGKRQSSMKAQGTAAVWKSEPPVDCPFPQSQDFPGIVFVGRFANYTDADTSA